MHTTPRYIVTIIVGTLAGCTILYMGTLAYCVISGQTPVESVMREFSTAGMFVAGYFCGMLSKTSGAPDPASMQETTVTKTSSEPPTTP